MGSEPRPSLSSPCMMGPMVKESVLSSILSEDADFFELCRFVDTVGDGEKYRSRLSEEFPGIRFVVAKKVDRVYPVVSGTSIVTKVTRGPALLNWVLDETVAHTCWNFGSGYPGSNH